MNDGYTGRDIVKRIDLAYVAGIVDGEGCISIIKHRDSDCRRGYYFHLTVNVSNTNEWLIAWLKFAFGGHTHTRKKGNYRPLYQWFIDASQAFKFLKLILPYLRIKKPQAELAIEFHKARERRRNPLNGRFIATKDQAYILEEAQKILLQKMKRD